MDSNLTQNIFSTLACGKLQFSTKYKDIFLKYIVTRLNLQG
ncbi:hypothetical protein CSUNSWCD_186 [Campylobacter showae CSUNSWCD]|uniref:Uncharacterized protein n=1 Tax=Campylobacter showae CSUNSWCD TaxID=1244083 RepID=M5IS86_9BACT|nr:hypothetical protein CSUNSWCD_186 [Campylobacter showae CSUNSWCD]